MGLVVESVCEVRRDANYDELVATPLRRMGFHTADGERAASDWGDVRRDRWWLLGTTSKAAYFSFDTLPPPPAARLPHLKKREWLLAPRGEVSAPTTAPLQLRSRALAPPRARGVAPAWCYDSVARRNGSETKVMREVAKFLLAAKPAIAPALAGKKPLYSVVNRLSGYSKLVSFCRQRVNAVRGGCAPTLTTTLGSSEWRVRDKFGIRVCVAAEVCAAHGFSQAVVAGMLAAARVCAARAKGGARMRPLEVRADALVRGAVGDGFCIDVAASMVARLVGGLLDAGELGE